MKLRCCALALFLAVVQAGLAQLPSGEYNLQVTNASAAVYNFAGDYDITQPMQLASGSELNLSFGATLTQDVRGRLRGSGITLFHVGNSANAYLAGFYTANGTVSTVAGVPTVTLRFTGHGKDVLGGVLTPFNITVKYVLSLTTDTNGVPVALTGKATGKATFSNFGNGTINDTVSIPVSGLDGTWGVQMNIVPLARLRGTGFILLPGGVSIPTRITGSYSSASGISSVNIVGAQSGAGNTVKLNFSFDTNGAPVIESLNGRLMGQTVQQ